MFWQILLSLLAAVGLLCVLWVLFGFLLPVCREGWLLYPGRTGKLTFVPVYCWLRGLGLLRLPLILADYDLSEGERAWLHRRDILTCSPEELARKLTNGAE